MIAKIWHFSNNVKITPRNILSQQKSEACLTPDAMRNYREIGSVSCGYYESAQAVLNRKILWLTDPSLCSALRRTEMVCLG